MTQTEPGTKSKPRMFTSLWSRSNKPLTTALFGECVHAATSRTCNYLGFTDPENKFQPSGATLREIFLMTYIQHSVQLNLTKMFSCTVMTQEQRFLLGTDWVWAVLDPPGKNTRIQIAVQVLHPPEKAEELFHKEITSTAGLVAPDRTRAERLVEFCSSIGRTCFALFLFFGRKNDPGNIYGLLSNNLHEALGKCVQINQEFIESFFKRSKGFVGAAGMLHAVMSKQDHELLTMLLKFT